MNDLFDHTFVVAEIAQAHDGSLGYAHAYIDAVAKTGADAIKFQTHFASEESTYDEPWRVQFSYQDKSRYDYWKRMEFTAEQWIELKNHAEQKGLVFMSSPFSIKAVELLDAIGIQYWKISSGEISNQWMLDLIIETNKPMIISTGMSSYEEIDRLVEKLKYRGSKFVLLQCTTKYPVSPEEIGLNVMTEYMTRYHVQAGLSDHSGTIFPSLAAVTLGAKVIEIHVCLSKDDFGPDVPASVTVSELKELVNGVHMIESMINSPVDKNEMSQELSSTNMIFSKSVCANCNLKKGSVLTKDKLALKKPGKGIKAAEADRILGKVLNKDKIKNEFINYDDVEDIQ